MELERPKRYHPALVTMHWLMLVLIFINLYLGIFIFEKRGPGGPNFQTLNTFILIHMVVGLSIIALLVARFIVRIRIRRPADATAGNRYFDMLAKLVHYGLYLAILVVTILGLVYSVQSGHFQSAFLGARSQFDGPPPGGFPAFNGTPRAPQGANGGANGGTGGSTAPGSQRGVGGPGGPGRPGGFFNLLIVHEWAAYALLALISLHFLAAMYHQFLRRDNLIARMWYGKRA